MTISDERPSHFIHRGLKDLPGHSLNNPSYKPRKVLFRHHDGRLLSGCGGDVEVFHPLELERSQSTGLPVRGTVVTVFSGKDTVIGIKAIDQGGRDTSTVDFVVGLKSGSDNIEEYFQTPRILTKELQGIWLWRPIQSGLLWRDGGILHVAYYDGYVRVGVIVEQYEDMLLVQDKSELVKANEQPRRKPLRERKIDRFGLSDSSLPKNYEEEDTNDEEISATHAEFYALKVDFRNHSIRADRVSQHLATLRKLLQISQKAVEANIAINDSIELTQSELDGLVQFSKIHNEYVKSGDYSMIAKSGVDFEERKYAIQELLRKVKVTETISLIEDWEKKVCSFYLGSCLGRTVSMFKRLQFRVASISLDSQYDTRLTAACLMNGVDGVYVTDNKEVFPIYFYREKRFFDAGNPISLPSFDYLTSILMLHDGMILGSCSGGLLHLEFDPKRKYDHFIIASSLMAHPFSHGPVNDLKILPTEDTYLALHCSDVEVVVSERDTGLSPDRWHRVTYHSGGALCLACTPFSLDHRGAFAIAGSKTYVRIKALHYTEDNMVGLHDLGQSRFTDENGKDIEVLNVSLDPAMECRPLPCKLRYSVGYADKAIRTYVALLTGQHEFTVSEKFVAQIEPLHCVSLMEVSITSMVRVVGKSCYLVLGYKDSRVQLFEERGKGTGKLDSVGWIDDCHPASDLRPVTELERIKIDVYLRMIENAFCSLFEKVPFEFALFGCGITMHKLTVDERKRLEKYRNFEF
ncbi:unnamed protein product [Angiostrongylus costaricensis]|uniref:Transducin family protein / WD-40 repeat family protein n=1 Tax=Angiostrongylus costaricensis TaxID=334426 RepID=A0A158PHV7_ANGCS|nr:unnamed protein product [Angiostrongylus costaricensis]